MNRQRIRSPAGRVVPMRLRASEGRFRQLADATFEGLIIHRDGIVLAGPAIEMLKAFGLIDRKDCVVLGLPAPIVSGALADAQAAWRGAFLARGTLFEPGRANALDIICPSTEAALALVGAARRLAVPTKAREVRGLDRVAVREETVAVMLDRLGARDTLLAWQERHVRQESRMEENRQANFENANLRRSARAAAATIARVERALEILGPEAPPHLVAAGQLRVVHHKAPLEELGRLASPPLTKDAIAGRLRRLLATADKTAEERGIPGTDAVVESGLALHRDAHVIEHGGGGEVLGRRLVLVGDREELLDAPAQGQGDGVRGLGGFSAQHRGADRKQGG